MGIFDKLKEIMTEPDDDFDEYDDVKSTDDFNVTASKSFDSKPVARDREEKSDRFERPTRRSKNNDKVLNIHTTAKLQVIVIKPERFDEAKEIGENLNDKKTVVVNFENTDHDTTRRILDFIAGVVFANNGQVKKIANKTIIVTPYDVGVMGDIIDELENNGMFV